jgi:hypothetical protein
VPSISLRAAGITPSAFLGKPFKPDALVRAVRRVLNAPVP